LEALRDAIAHGRRVAFDYVDAAGAPSRRQVDPLALTALRDHWLLTAWDVAQQAERRFRLERVSHVRALGPRGPRPDGRGPATAEPLADVVFRPEERWRADQLASPLPLAELPGGGLQMALEAGRTEWIARLALAGGGRIEVLGPDDLRERVRRAAQDALA
jgi:proteasome accessory factor C